jgi:hypothetical protein
MEKMFGTSSGLQVTVDKYIGEFLEEKKKVGLVVSSDLIELVHRILYEGVFKRSVTKEYAKQFVALQSKIVALGTIGQLLPASLYSFLSPIREEIATYIDEYEPLIDALWGDELRAGGEDACAPSGSCTRQAAAMVFDAFYSAGGLSVPTTISTGVGLLFSEDDSNPFKQASYRVDQALQFYWENLRYFAPVVGFPHWETRPVCAGSTADATQKLNEADGRTKACPLGGEATQGYPNVNQYQGGIRVVPNMAIAQRDLRVWGSDGNEFKIRPVSEYITKSVGFAEMAVDNSVAGGRMNRVCPGKTVALMIGSSFFAAFEKSDWATPRIPITFGSGPSYVSSFTLSTKQMVADCNEVCPSCGLSASCVKELSKCELEKHHCKVCKSCKANPPKWWHGWNFLRCRVC